MRKLTIILLALILAAALVACGGSPAPDSSGGAADAAAGQKLFQQRVIGTQPGCANCHSLEKDMMIVGPSLAGIASRAGSREAGKTAEQYLAEAITNPNAFTVEGYTTGTMPASLGKELSDQQVKDLVAYMLTLK